MDNTEIKIKRNELLALHSCIMIVLNNDIPSPADAGILTEALSDIAAQDKGTNKEFNLKLKRKQLEPLWHCCNIVLKNNLHKDHIHATGIIPIFGKIGIVIDQAIAMNKRPNLELV